MDFCDPDQSKVKAVLDELEILFPKPNEEESDEEGPESEGSGDDAVKRKKRRKKMPVRKKLRELSDRRKKP